MKLKKILLPIFVGVMLLSASLIAVMAGTTTNQKIKGDCAIEQVADIEANIDLDDDVLTNETIDGTEMPGKAAQPGCIFGLTLTYTGEPQALATTSAYSPIEGDLYCSLTTPLTDDNYWIYGSPGIPTATDAGSYTVYYYITGNDEYESKSESAVTAQINKMAGSITLGYSSNTVPLSHDGYTDPWTGGRYDDMNFIEYSHYDVDGYAGEYQVTADSADVTTKMIGSIIYISWNTTQHSIGDVITITVTASETTNYSSASAQYVITLGKRQNPVVVSANNIVYDGASHALVTATDAIGAVEEMYIFRDTVCR